MFDKLVGILRLNDVDDDLDDDYEEEPEVENKAKNSSFKSSMNSNDGPEEEVVKPQRVVRSMPKQPRKITPADSMKVCVIKPESVDDAREITDTLLEGRTVVLNLEGLDFNIAQRVMDFTSGSCYAMNGNLQKISNSIIIVTPANVDISGDFPNIMSSNGSPEISTI